MPRLVLRLTAPHILRSERSPADAMPRRYEESEGEDDGADDSEEEEDDADAAGMIAAIMILLYIAC